MERNGMERSSAARDIYEPEFFHGLQAIAKVALKRRCSSYQILNSEGIRGKSAGLEQVRAL